MSCNSEIYCEFKNLGESACPFCDKKIVNNCDKIDEPFCENKELINNEINVCMRCGVVNS